MLKSRNAWTVTAATHILCHLLFINFLLVSLPPSIIEHNYSVNKWIHPFLSFYRVYYNLSTTYLFFLKRSRFTPIRTHVCLTEPLPEYLFNFQHLRSYISCHYGKLFTTQYPFCGCSLFHYPQRVFPYFSHILVV